MTFSDVPNFAAQFESTLQECRDLYVSSGRLCAEEHPRLLSMPGDKFLAMMDDLHRALLVKVYVSVCEADREWSSEERCLAQALFIHLWGQRLSGEHLRAAAREAATQAARLKWYSLVRPFDQIAPLREQIGALETVVMRLANIIARTDGPLNARESAVIKLIQQELHHHLRPIPIDEPTRHEESNAVGAQAIESLEGEAADIHAVAQPRKQGSKRQRPKDAAGASGRLAQDTANALEEALRELDSLIGLDAVKKEVRTLTNFLKLQQRRERAGLPETEISLHMVFTGNPGTGKTSVARVIGRIFGAMGILSQGHLVETDRSGLVAEYAGQTGPKTNAKIDEALDGVLFIDEAYSLVARQSDDPYGHEAVQVLLKRAEDDRRRLVVILAGYPDEMRALLSSNPGLCSRFSRQLQFDDYSPLDLARIFSRMCKKNHYTLPAETRIKLMLGLVELHQRRDRHFGNGRTVRNLFEHAIRRMADRIADIPQLSDDELSRLVAEDVEFEGLPRDWFASDGAHSLRFRIACPGCGHTSRLRGEYLGLRVRCPKCQRDFAAEWGEVES